MLKNVIQGRLDSEGAQREGWRGGVGNGGKYFICLQYSGSQCKEGLDALALGKEIKNYREYKVFVGP